MVNIFKIPLLSESMKKAIILLIAVLLFYCIPDAFALDSIVVTNNKEYISFDDIIAKYNSLKTNIESKRNNSETIDAYKNRIEKSKENLDSFLNTVYEGKFDLDNVSLDWGNNLLIISRKFPVEYIMGEGEPCKELAVSIAQTHLRLRELITFKKFIKYIITFKINENCEMQLIQLKVVYREEELIHATDLSSL